MSATKLDLNGAVDCSQHDWPRKGPQEADVDLVVASSVVTEKDDAEVASVVGQSADMVSVGIEVMDRRMADSTAMSSDGDWRMKDR